MRRVGINAGIGDLILSRALLDSVGEPMEVAIDVQALVHYRSEAHTHFAGLLFESLFQEPLYRRVPQDGAVGLTPQQLAYGLGVRPALPRLSGDLPGEESDRWRGCVAVTTKVRGWHRFRYTAFRHHFLAAIESLSKRSKVVLVGERQIGLTREYQHHGESLIYSIYQDLLPFAAIDETVEELGETPPMWGRFERDCEIMRSADAVVTLGSGGNVSMAIACGRAAVAMIAFTEMGAYMAAMPSFDGISLCHSNEQYLAAVEAIAR